MSLSVDQRSCIYNFVVNRVPKQGVLLKGSFLFVRKYLFPLTKDYNSITSFHKFIELRNAIENPENFATELGLDVEDKAQIQAAKILLKKVIRSPYSHFENFRELSVNKKETAKRELLARNDPVQKLPVNPTPLDYVLANVHFLDPVARNIISDFVNGERVNQRTIVYAPHREKVRGLIKDKITEIFRSEDTRHLIEALGLLIKKEKGHIFCSSMTGRVGALGAPYNAQGNLFHSIQFYNSHHSIFMGSLVNPFDESICSDWSGAFIHEVQHFLFNRILENRSSPVKEGGEKQIDEVLAKDRAHRATLHEKRGSAYDTFVELLEKDEGYFPGGFNEEDVDHRHTMRVEAIVRIMEQIAMGVSHEEVQRVAPNLYNYYFESAKPLFEEFSKNAEKQPIGDEGVLESFRSETKAEIENRIKGEIEEVQQKIITYSRSLPTDPLFKEQFERLGLKGKTRACYIQGIAWKIGLGQVVDPDISALIKHVKIRPCLESIGKIKKELDGIDGSIQFIDRGEFCEQKMEEPYGDTSDPVKVCARPLFLSSDNTVISKAIIETEKDVGSLK